jgi:hypothetical protein
MLDTFQATTTEATDITGTIAQEVHVNYKN